MDKKATKEIFDTIVKLRGHVLHQFQSRRISVLAMGALHMLWAGGEHAVSDIAKQLGVSAPSVSVMLKEFYKKELIRRHKDPDDRRRVLISLTPRGVTMVEEHVKNIIHEMFGHLSPNDRKKYIEIINKIHNHFSNTKKK